VPGHPSDIIRVLFLPIPNFLSPHPPYTYHTSCALSFWSFLPSTFDIRQLRPGAQSLNSAFDISFRAHPPVVDWSDGIVHLLSSRSSDDPSTFKTRSGFHTPHNLLFLTYTSVNAHEHDDNVQDIITLQFYRCSEPHRALENVGPCQLAKSSCSVGAVKVELQILQF